MRKILALVLSAALFAAAACGGSGGSNETVKLLVWGPQEGQAFLEKVIEEFKAANPGTNYEFELGVVGEDKARERLAEDPEAGADVFAFVDDTLRDFVNAGLLYEVTRNADDIRSRNMTSSVDIATLDGKLWAYPQTADNGYFFYYDKSALSESDVLSLDAVIAASKAAGKRFTFPLGVAWVTASWFLADGNLSLENGGQVVDFNNAAGANAVLAMQSMVDSGAWAPGWVDELIEGIGTTLTGGVGGTWMAADIEAALGANYGATKLPSATIGGRQVQLSSFVGCKLVGVNSQTKNPVAAMDFANFLTSEKMQLLNFEMRGIGPTNVNVADSATVKADIALAALAQQSKYAYPQRDVQGSYWGPVEAVGNLIINGEVGDIQSVLDEMVKQIME